MRRKPKPCRNSTRSTGPFTEPRTSQKGARQKRKVVHRFTRGSNHTLERLWQECAVQPNCGKQIQVEPLVVVEYREAARGSRGAAHGSPQNIRTASRQSSPRTAMPTRRG